MTNLADERTTLDDLKALVRRFCVARDWDAAHTPKDLAIGLVTEASELLELFRFVPEAELADRLAARRGEIADELADALYCVLRFAQLYDFDLSRALEEKLLKTAVKYPAHQ